MGNVGHLITPALVIEGAKLERNIRRMADAISHLGVDLRPHLKTLKCLEPARRAIAAGAKGITVSTVREAEYFADHGFTDIVYAVGIAPSKLPRLAALRARGIDVRILLDSIDQVAMLAGLVPPQLDLGVLIELDCDGKRSGAAPEGEALIDIASAIDATAGLTLAGVLTHAGGSYDHDDEEALRAFALQERDAAVLGAARIRDAGLRCDIVSVGSTPTALSATDLTGVSEVRAGVYMTFDLMQVGLGVCTLDDVAISVVATVIGHRPSLGWLILDAGWTALSSDRGTATQRIDRGYGMVGTIDGTWMPHLVVRATTQEHGIVDVTNTDHLLTDFPIGTCVRILPNHACATAAMHERYHVLDGNEVIDEWHSIRGW